MKEFKAIVDAYKKIDLNSRQVALATVVKVMGSSYRSPGARMLIMDDGKWVGSISGGCLEGDALRKARQVMSTEKAIVVRYDTREESNQNLGISLGCNGVIDVLIEPVVKTDSQNPIKIFEHLIQLNTIAAIATGCGNDSFIRKKIILSESEELTSTFENLPLEKKIKNDLYKILDTKESRTTTYPVENVTTDVFLELVQPSVSLVIFGGGFDARPVCQLANALGWEVTVTDECVAHIAPIFFPEAQNLSLCHRETFDKEIHVNQHTACVLMSHNYEYDRDVLRKLINSETPYIGILGPRKRFDKMVEEFEKEGISLQQESLHKIHSPIGLDIGAETPDEIALSIIAEIQSKFSKRSGGFLKYRQGPIHQRDANSEQVFKQVYLTSSDEDKRSTN